MKVKVCGLKYPVTISEVENIEGVNYSGFIFYEKSPRYVGNLVEVPKKGLNIKRVGVFVNPTIEEISRFADRFSLDIIQLHGKEPNSFCEKVKKQGFKVIKAVPIADKKDFEITASYSPENIDYFLLDTKTPKYGGSGKKFDWNLLDNYKVNIPFFLSGGISFEDKKEIENTNNKYLKAIDLNSRFESKPGFKKVELIKEFITNLN